MFFVGIDLAWSNSNSTGIAIIKGNIKNAKLCDATIVYSNDEIIDYINKIVKEESAFIAIDAPLIVPNEEGRREAERLIGIFFQKYDAGAYPANRKLLSKKSETIRSEELCKQLEKERFEHNPYINQFEDNRKFFEIYPHPSMVVLFKLSKILRYKKKTRRTYESVWNEFERYQESLKKLENPSLMLPNEIIEKNVVGIKGKNLKYYEDKLDAIFCSYVAYYSWVHPENCAVFGNMNQGYILSPIFPYMRKQLEKYCLQMTI